MSKKCYNVTHTSDSLGKLKCGNAKVDSTGFLGISRILIDWWWRQTGYSWSKSGRFQNQFMRCKIIWVPQTSNKDWFGNIQRQWLPYQTWCGHNVPRSRNRLGMPNLHFERIIWPLLIHQFCGISSTRPWSLCRPMQPASQSLRYITRTKDSRFFAKSILTQGYSFQQKGTKSCTIASFSRMSTHYTNAATILGVPITRSCSGATSRISRSSKIPDCSPEGRPVVRKVNPFTTLSLNTSKAEKPGKTTIILSGVWDSVWATGHATTGKLRNYHYRNVWWNPSRNITRPG